MMMTLLGLGIGGAGAFAGNKYRDKRRIADRDEQREYDLRIRDEDREYAKQLEAEKKAEAERLDKESFNPIGDVWDLFTDGVKYDDINSFISDYEAPEWFMNQGGRIGYEPGGPVYEGPSLGDFGIDYGPNRSITEYPGPFSALLDTVTPDSLVEKFRDLFGMETDYEEALRIQKEINEEARAENNQGGRVGYEQGGIVDLYKKMNHG